MTERIPNGAQPERGTKEYVLGVLGGHVPDSDPEGALKDWLAKRAESGIPDDELGRMAMRLETAEVYIAAGRFEEARALLGGVLLGAQAALEEEDGSVKSAELATILRTARELQAKFPSIH